MKNMIAISLVILMGSSKCKKIIEYNEYAPIGGQRRPSNLVQHKKSNRMFCKTTTENPSFYIYIL